MALKKSVRLRGCQISHIPQQQKDKFRNVTSPETSCESTHQLAGWSQPCLCSVPQNSIKMAAAFTFPKQSGPVKFYFQIAKT